MFKKCNNQIENLTLEVNELKIELALSKKQLQTTQKVLKDVTNEKRVFKKQRNAAEIFKKF